MQGSTDLIVLVQKIVFVVRPKSHRDVQGVCEYIRNASLTKDELLEVKSVTRGVRMQGPLAFVNETKTMLKRKDFASLRGFGWLNDEVTNSFVALTNAGNDQYHKVVIDVSKERKLWAAEDLQELQ